MELNQIPHLPIDAESTRQIRNRTKLQKCLLLGLILASVVILAFIVHTVRIEIGTCGTPECMQIAARVLEHLDKDVDPCEDFYRFACGKVANVTSTENYPKRLLKNKISQRLQELLEEPIDETDSPIFNYEKDFYSACIADKKGAQSLKTLKEIFNDLNGWPLVVGSSWEEQSFDWLEWVSKFRKYGLRHDQILGFDVMVDSINPMKQIVKLYPPPYMGMPKGVKEVAVMFGANDDVTLDREIGDMLDFMKKIQEIRVKHINYTHEPPTRALANEFQEKHKDLDWLHYINSLTEPEHTIRPDDYLEFMYTDCVKTALELVRASPKRTVANYMFWRAVDDLYSIIISESLDIYDMKRTRVDICKEILRYNFSPWSSFVAYGKKFLTNNSRERATVIFNHVKREFKRLFNINKWMTEGDKQKFRYKFNTMTEIVGITNDTIIHSTYHDLFKDNLIPKDGFLKMYLNLKTTLNTLSNNARFQQHSQDWRYLQFLLDTDTIYFGTQNAIMLPIGALQDWYYDEYGPMYVNFATIGKNLAVTFAKVITSIDVAFEEKIRWSEETLKNYEEETNCVEQKEVKSLMVQYYDYKILELGQIVGLKVAYNAYKKWVEENEEELPAKGTGYSTNQLFWIIALTDSCFEDAYDFNFFVHNEPIQRNPNFASDFSCSTNAKMNPPKKCSLL
ncbi:hypothetical protein PPYR_00630 [Photinus pyralis]|uniref:Peptidase M13 N-terminal domain-containing protein n=1 Tax=Photinus pyralis TaxID=7054 RepID=A0A5N4B2P1_PHOPY|nr:neprilysin-2-like isoform X2 [Photinus pyralis]KAB0803660.1 hypothetical protein PPYR_00630 [Photinus pyralis]